ncbi:MAG: hypothetical protein LQ340_007346, partial [Diploschistes diacapsis]
MPPPSVLSYPKRALRSHRSPFISRTQATRRLSLLTHRRPHNSTQKSINLPSPVTPARHLSSTPRPCAAHQSAAAHAAAPTPLSQDSYHKHADAYIDALVAELEELQEEREEVDVEYS